MRILLTNNSLCFRSGSDLYVRDVALELLRRGHRPVVFTTYPGVVGDELKAATVPVIDRLEQLGEPPDIIHGHHHYDALIALLRFPRTPAVYFCHGWTPWQEAPLHHPNIRRYAAVSEVCRERLIAEGGIPSNRIELVSNFFDVRRFPPRPPLPARPTKAVAFGNEFHEGAAAPILRAACQARGIHMDVFGLCNGNPVADPGPLLAGYDVVFAKGRAAIEALAVGASVIVSGHLNLGSMVSTCNIDELRRLNFGLRTFVHPLTVEAVDAELAKYDPADAAAVTRYVRSECELQPAVDRLIGIYESVLADGPLSPVSWPDAAACAGEYLEHWALRYKEHAYRNDLKLLTEGKEAAEQLAAFRVEQSRILVEQIRILNEQVGTLNEQIDILNEQVGTLNEQIDVQNEAGVRASAQSDAAWREHVLELQRLALERDDANRLILMLEERVGQRQDELASALEDAGSLSEQLRDIETRYAKTLSELAAVRSSKTWRWSQAVLRSFPLRLLFGRAAAGIQH